MPDSTRTWTRSLLPLALLGLGLSGCSGSAPDTTLPSPPPGCDRAEPFAQDALQADLAWLAAPELDGRSPGSAGDTAAAAFLADRFECIGLSPLEGAVDYLQPFTTSEGDSTQNVLGLLPGSEDALGDELIVVSAHFDHLGDGYLGANDNASGVSALLAIAQDLVSRAAWPSRSILFAAFGAEELGYEGSEALMAEPPAGFSPQAVVYNLNLDMVGTYTQSEVLYVLGSFQNTPGRAAVDSYAPDYPDLELDLGEESSESDNASFCTRGVSYLFFWTEDEECYHETCDTADRIDYPSLAQVAQLVADVTLELATGTDLSAEEIDRTEDVCSAL